MENKDVKLTYKEESFCNEFIKDFNATKSAERAKYSVKTARHIGYENLTKPHIKKRIADLLAATEMEDGEIKKRFSNIARTNMKDYLVKRLVPHTPQVKVGLEVIIKSHLDHIRREEEFRDEKGLTEEAFDKFNEGLEYYRDQIIRMRIELRDNPAAFRIVDGETQMIEVAELDLVKVVDDKECGIIKSIKHTKDGISIEPYSADNALTTLAKFKGMLVEKSEVDLTVDTVVKIGYGNGNQGA